MTWPWAVAAARRLAERELHLGHLKAVTDAANLAMSSLLQQAKQARDDASKAQAEADARLVRDREAYLAAITAIRDVAETNSQVIAGLTASIQSYLELFKVNQTVQGHVHTDISEWMAEQEDGAVTKALALGFPQDLGPEAQLAWVLAQTGKE